MQRTRRGFAPSLAADLSVGRTSVRLSGRAATVVLALGLGVGCGLPNPDDSRPAKRMRQALHLGMTLREVCAIVTPLAPDSGSCLVGRGCKGEWDILAVELRDRGYRLSRYRRPAQEDVVSMPPDEIERALQDLRSCSLLKVGYGYYDVHLKLDDVGRVREISPVLIEDNPEMALP